MKFGSNPLSVQENTWMNDFDSAIDNLQNQAHEATNAKKLNRAARNLLARLCMVRHPIAEKAADEMAGAAATLGDWHQEVAADILRKLVPLIPATISTSASVGNGNALERSQAQQVFALIKDVL